MARGRRRAGKAFAQGNESRVALAAAWARQVAGSAHHGREAIRRGVFAVRSEAFRLARLADWAGAGDRRAGQEPGAGVYPTRLDPSRNRNSARGAGAVVSAD